MKLSALFGAAIVLFSATVFAHDLTYTGPIKTGQTKNVKVELPAGKMIVEVFSSFSDTKFTCQFQTGYGGVVLEQSDTHKCVGTFTTQTDATMTISVKNLGKDSDYKIWVHDS